MEDLEGKYFRELTFLCLCIAFVFAKEGNNQALYGCSKPRQKKQKKRHFTSKVQALARENGSILKIL
jgi:hypothetical protein